MSEFSEYPVYRSEFSLVVPFQLYIRLWQHRLPAKNTIFYFKRRKTFRVSFCFLQFLRGATQTVGIASLRQPRTPFRGTRGLSVLGPARHRLQFFLSVQLMVNIRCIRTSACVGWILCKAESCGYPRQSFSLGVSWMLGVDLPLQLYLLFFLRS